MATTYTILDDPHGYARMYGYIASTPSTYVPEFYKGKYEKLANKYWDKFYTNHTTHFFKNRHWIEREFPELVGKDTKKVLEVGCGVGNTTFPLLERNNNLIFDSFDFSKVAVEHMKLDPQFEKYSNRCKPFVYDISQEELPDVIEKSSFDFVIIIFVLSAIAPAHMAAAVARMREALRPGGMVLLRDYAQYDLAQQRLEVTPKVSMLDENYMVRGDGTLSYYFSLEYLETLFTENGFIVLENKVVVKDMTNKKQEKQMHRLFAQGKYMKPTTDGSSSQSSSSHSAVQQGV
eukprot:Phypoly_transcript_09800.p1 GENE.Phypoly_transcript_09800~~Phypoly_transcript_09800.p1  ORF type:complete len:290 (+),score=45.66 Phypoly_transcript_09800:75-944(+)